MASVNSREVKREEDILSAIIDASCEHETGLILEDVMGRGSN